MRIAAPTPPRIEGRRVGRRLNDLIWMARMGRKDRAMARLKLFRDLDRDDHPLYRPPHCCRDKPRDRLRRTKRPSLAWDRAYGWECPF
ncbi:MAG: hypothetical protein ACTHOJ_17200 [Sphingomonas oligoaromativorans]